MAAILPVDQVDGRPILEARIPVDEIALIGMRRQAADRVHPGTHPVRVAPEPHLIGAVDEATTQGTHCLVANDDDMTFRSPDVVFQMVLYAPARTHAAPCDDDGACLDFIDQHRLLGRACLEQVGKVRIIASRLEQLRGEQVPIT